MGPRLLLFGPPGVGKGTHSRRLASDLGVPYVATGDMFREAAKLGLDAGLEIAACLARGELVPDRLAIEMAAERLDREDAQRGFLLDGFPRTVLQAEALERMTARTRPLGPSDRLLVLEAPVEVLVERISGRLTCKWCQASFNRSSRPPRTPGVCDACAGPLVQRGDDAASVVLTRLEEYEEKTAPVIERLRSQGWSVRPTLAVGELEAVYRRIREAAAS
jgi:adenylate kinase